MAEAQQQTSPAPSKTNSNDVTSPIRSPNGGYSARDETNDGAVSMKKEVQVETLAKNVGTEAELNASMRSIDSGIKEDSAESAMDQNNSGRLPPGHIAATFRSTGRSSVSPPKDGV